MASSPVAPAEVFQRVTAGKALAEGARILDVAQPSMVIGADCSADPCWIIAEQAMDVVADDGRTLGSTKARQLVSYWARGKSVAYKGTQHLLHEQLLDVMWAVDPGSFFFAYLDSSTRKLMAVPPPHRQNMHIMVCKEINVKSRVGTIGTYTCSRRVHRECTCHIRRPTHIKVIAFFCPRGCTLPPRRPNRAHGPFPRCPHQHGVVRSR